MSVTITTFGDIPKAIQDGSDAAILELVQNVVTQAKRICPFDTGQLRNSIMGQVKGGSYGHQGGPTLSERPKEGEGYVGTAVAHGIYNEFGTRYMPAQPYLRPAIAVEANGQKAASVIKELQLEAVKAGMKKGPRKKVTS